MCTYGQLQTAKYTLPIMSSRSFGRLGQAYNDVEESGPLSYGMLRLQGCRYIHMLDTTRFSNKRYILRILPRCGMGYIIPSICLRTF